MRSISKILFATILLLSQTPGLPQTTKGNNSGDPLSAQVPSPGQPNTQLDFQTDLFTGRFGYVIPLPLAPARHGSTPNVVLRYTSGSENGWCGVGWDLDLGYIERETRYGVPALWGANGAAPTSYDDFKGFVFSLNGRSSHLVKTGSGIYRAEIEGGFLKFQLTGNSWLVTDKSGNQYYFGESNNTRTTNAHWGAAAASTTFRWALDKVITVDSDVTTISYQCISNKLYPVQLAYNGNTAGAKTNFTLDFNLTDRPDPKISAKSGFVVAQTKLLDSIVHKIDGNLVWSNKLNYTQSASTKRSLLTSSIRFGTNQTSACPTNSFVYQQQQFGFQTTNHWDGIYLPSGATNDTTDYGVTGLNIDIADMDGDGLPDRIISQVPLWSFTQTNWWVQLNTGSNLAVATTWGPLGYQTYSNGVISTYNSPLWSLPQSSQGRLVDINGDGKADRVIDPIESFYNWGNSNAMLAGYNRHVVQLNGGTNLMATNDWTGVEDQVLGDGVTIATTANYRAIENTGYTTLTDMNGDGLPDRVMTDVRISSKAVNRYIVQFNTGSGFVGSNTFAFPSETDKEWSGLVNQDPAITGPSSLRLIDINGDGLPDRVMLVRSTTSTGPAPASQQTYYIVELNNGYSFEPAMTWTNVDSCTEMTQSSGAHWPGYAELGDSYQVVLRDVNGDGLPDRILLPETSSYTNWLVQLNTGAGFANTINWGSMETQGQSQDHDFCGIQTAKSLFLDVNGDGLPDRVISKYSPLVSDKFWIVQLSKGPYPDLMTVASNGIGGSVAINYQLSTAYNNHQNADGTGPQLLPFPQWTVSALVEKDGVCSTNTSTYNYEGGMWGFDRRELNGFAKVTAVDPLGLTSVHYFYQCGGRNYSSLGEYNDSKSTIGKKGMEYRVDTYGSDTKLYKTVLNKIEETLLDSVRHFAFVTNTITVDYNSPGSGSYRARAEQFNYDSNGNLTNHIDYGEVTSVVFAMTNTLPFTGSGMVYRRVVMAGLNNASILDKPFQVLLASDSGFSTILRETQYAYDQNTGNPTKISNRICSGTYAVTTNVYDSFNNLWSESTPAGVTTLTTYDPTYHLYPATNIVGGTVTNIFVYDARSGKLSEHTSPAGLVTDYYYDPFLRLIGTAISTSPRSSPTLWTATNWYSLGGIAADGSSKNYVQVRKNDDLGGFDTWMYLDGIGRAIQTRVESEQANNLRVQDTVYDKRGAVQFASLPYLASGTLNAAPMSKVGTLYQYDPIGRLISTTAAETPTYNGRVYQSASTSNNDGVNSPVASSLIGYYDASISDPWTIVKTNEVGSVLKLRLDGLGRTNKVIESISGTSYTTTYSYDAAGTLFNIADSSGNNNIQYSNNCLGQVVAMADPDLGAWLYVRDSAGRVVQQTDANTQKVVFHYSDALGRVSSRDVYDFKGNLAYTVAYYYDSNYGDSGFTVFPGQLYKTTDKEGWEKHSYDYRGREVTTSRYVARNGKTYTTQFGYDDMDRVTSTTYPNGGPIVTNTYNSGGFLATVSKLGGTAYYSATTFDDVGHVTTISYGNGINTSYGYYTYTKRLQSIANNVQNLNYTYDAAADVKTITDGKYSGINSAGITATSYDDLQRLTSLTRSGGSPVNFGFNAIGNLTSNGEATNASTYGYSSRIAHAVTNANGNNYAYDLNGNMLVRGKQHLEYDPENHLVLVRTPAATTTFGYDGAGSRLWKQTSSTNGLQVWIGNIYEEKNGKTLYHIYAAGTLVCTFDSGTAVVDYYQSDHLHSSSILTDAGGNLTQHYEYYAYGQDRYTYSATAFPVTRRYTSQSKDDETGLYCYGARYYDPELGRFIQPDTAIPNLFNPQCLNRYSYCLGNPLKYLDPTGHETYWEGVGNVWLGYYDASAELVKGTVSIVIHPVNTISGVATAVSHPISTGEAIINGVAADWNSGTRGQGKIVGTILLAVGTAAASEAELGNLSKVGEVANASTEVEQSAQATASLVSGPCFVAGTAIATTCGPRPIESIRVGDRVLAPGDNQIPGEIDLADLKKWRKVTLRMPNPDGSRDIIELQLLRPIVWVQSSARKGDSEIWLNINELDLKGWATVTETSECPPIQVGEGRIVLGTITHLNSYVMEMGLEGEGQLFEPTDRHRLFSATRNAWVSAVDIKVGEELSTRVGSVKVLSVSAKPGTHRVYNLEVEAEHCFYAGTLQVLSHNSCAASRLPRMQGMGAAERESTLTKGGFNKSKVSKSSAKNETWTNPDGSEVRVHPYGNEKQTPYKSGNNAHLHKETPNGDQLNDRGIISNNPNETHIGLPNPSDFQKIRARPDGS